MLCPRTSIPALRSKWTFWVEDDIVSNSKKQHNNVQQAVLEIWEMGIQTAPVCSLIHSGLTVSYFLHVHNFKTYVLYAVMMTTI